MCFIVMYIFLEQCCVQMAEELQELSEVCLAHVEVFQEVLINIFGLY